MFLFVSDEEMLRRDILKMVPRQWGRPRFYDVSEGKLLFFDSAFTECVEKQELFEVRCMRKGIDSRPICGIRWSIGSATMELFRQWSGEFLLYYSDDLSCIASHLKLKALLTDGLKIKLTKLDPGQSAVYHRTKGRWVQREAHRSRFLSRFPYSFESASRHVRGLIYNSVKQLPDNAALLLSGGIDSSSVAVAAINQGKKFQAFTIATAKKWEPKHDPENDRICAKHVAEYLGVSLHEVHISPKRLLANIPLAVYLSETHRGTIIDESAALIELAKQIRRAGFSQVWTGETADDLFGGFKFPLRYLRGQKLRRHFQLQLEQDAPNELAIVQNNFAPWNISVCHPLWTSDLLRIGYNLPLNFRVEPAATNEDSSSRGISPRTPRSHY